jgi:hypothetical protein
MFYHSIANIDSKFTLYLARTAGKPLVYHPASPKRVKNEK